MAKYGLHGKFKATPGNSKQLAELLLKASEIVVRTQGCHLYIIGQDKTEPDAVWITEVWDSKEDHDQSLSLPAVRELIGQAMPLLDGMPEKGQELEILGGVGIPD